MRCNGNSWDSAWFDAVFDNQDVIGYFPAYSHVRYWINSLTDVNGVPVHFMFQEMVFD